MSLIPERLGRRLRQDSGCAIALLARRKLSQASRETLNAVFANLSECTLSEDTALCDGRHDCCAPRCRRIHVGLTGGCDRLCVRRHRSSADTHAFGVLIPGANEATGPCRHAAYHTMGHQCLLLPTDRDDAPLLEYHALWSLRDQSCRQAVRLLYCTVYRELCFVNMSRFCHNA